MERTIVKNNIGEVLRLLRIAYDLSISELSKRTKISKSYITEIEKGEKNPSDKILKNYSTGLGIPEETLNYLLNILFSKTFVVPKIVNRNFEKNS